MTIWIVISLLYHRQLLKIENFGKSFDQLTKETVKVFLVDNKKSNFKIYLGIGCRIRILTADLQVISEVI
jgi:hypothetical protein